MGIPLCVTCCFSLAAFNVCSLCLIVVNLTNMCLGVFHLGFILFGTLGFLNLCHYFFPRFGEVFNFYPLECLLMAFLSVFFWNSSDSNVGLFHIVPEVPEVVLISFNSFFFFPLGFIYLKITCVLRINKHKIDVLKTIENKARRRKKYALFTICVIFTASLTHGSLTDDVSKK